MPVQQVNSSFAPDQRLQLAWDSTSMGALKTCPRLYKYSIVDGMVASLTNVHLIFGQLYHAALERYDHAKATGASHEAATIAAVRYAMTETWNDELNRPWASDDPNKNRFTLVRTIVWYLEQFAEDAIETIILANGKPAVELSFRVQIHYESPYGSPYLWCGHMDRVGRVPAFDNKVFVIDKKTTKTTITPNFFDKYTPDNQFSGYIFASQIALEQPAAGLIVDVAQVAVTFSRFQRGLVTRDEGQIQEWLTDIGWWIKQAEGYAKADYWPMNDKSCDMYGGCTYRSICSKSPLQRDQWLKAGFAKRVWDPLQVRGDI